MNPQSGLSQGTKDSRGKRGIPLPLYCHVPMARKKANSYTSIMEKGLTSRPAIHGFFI